MSGQICRKCTRTPQILTTPQVFPLYAEDMKRLVQITGLCIALSLVYALPIRAEEEAAPAKSESAEAPKGDKKAEGEGEEGGGKKKQKGDVSGGRFAGDPVFVHL